METNKKSTDRPLEQQPDDAQRRRGSRRSAGADTPAGMQTDRTVTPAKREQEKKGLDFSKHKPGESVR